MFHFLCNNNTISSSFFSSFNFFAHRNCSGCVTGLLKVGTKTLYVFDENGETKPVPAMCVLDFYVHESRQRAGLGREMFDVMLEREGVEPQKLAIDRPSDKLIAFLRKHYGKHAKKKMNSQV